tara:strand:- start:262 stop:456 length:195 start_codon:yes stop_codon:yes gene_type:complete
MNTKISNITLIDDNTTSVLCKGDKASGSHPQIFLNVRADDGKIECYYCGKTFIWKSVFQKKNAK